MDNQRTGKLKQMFQMKIFNIENRVNLSENQHIKNSNQLFYLVRKREKFRNNKEIKLLLAHNNFNFLNHKQI